MVWNERWMTDAATFTRDYLTGYGATVRRLIRRGAQHDVAEDVAQSAWAKSWAKREQFHGPGPYLHWVLVIAENLYRVTFQHKPFVSLMEFDWGYVDPIDKRIEASQVLARCAPRDAEVLRRRYIDDSLPSPLTVALRVQVLRAVRRAGLACAPGCGGG